MNEELMAKALREHEKREELLDALHARAMGGDNEAACILLQQPTRVVLDDGARFCNTKMAYLAIWEALTSRKISIPDARELVAIMDSIEKYL
jgi:hypothetical protein